MASGDAHARTSFCVRSHPGSFWPPLSDRPAVAATSPRVQKVVSQASHPQDRFWKQWSASMCDSHRHSKPNTTVTERPGIARVHVASRQSSIFVQIQSLLRRLGAPCYANTSPIFCPRESPGTFERMGASPCAGYASRRALRSSPTKTKQLPMNTESPRHLEATITAAKVLPRIGAPIGHIIETSKSPASQRRRSADSTRGELLR